MKDNKISKILKKTKLDIDELEEDEEALKAFWEDITMEYDFWMSFDEFKKKVNNDIPIMDIARKYQNELDEDGDKDE